ncbi:CYTH domain-containing protein [bacterium]|nr:CYTH domain-containing protein [bacterium]
MEIERKYVVDPEASVLRGLLGSGQRIVQAYLAIEEGGSEVRIRRKGGQAYLTVKGRGGLERSEEEIEISGAQFETLLPAAQGREVEKTRYEIPLEESDGLVAELDIFHGVLEGLAVVEVEFASLEQAEQFTPPPWFGVEKTNDARFQNRSLAVFGIPSVDPSVA